jgi:hypothetical protein
MYSSTDLKSVLAVMFRLTVIANGFLAFKIPVAVGQILVPRGGLPRGRRTNRRAIRWSAATGQCLKMLIGREGAHAFCVSIFGRVEHLRETEWTSEVNTQPK